MLVSGQKDQKRDKYTEGIDMDITIGIICMQMQERYQIETILPIERDVLVKGFQIWDGEDPKPDILYVCQETPPAHTRWNRKMQIGAGLDLHVMNGTAFTISGKTPMRSIPYRRSSRTFIIGRQIWNNSFINVKISL